MDSAVNNSSTSRVSVLAPRRFNFETSPIGRIEKVCLASLLVLFVAFEIRAATLRPLWFDELSTLIVSTVPSIGEMLRAIPADGNPPLYFLLARISIHLPVSTELALRLPSIAAINIAAMMIYLFVRRNTSALFAFLAMGIFIAGPFGRFAALEARPYALLLCFTGIAICCWQSATRGQHRRLALAGIMTAMAGAIFSQPFGLIYVALPLLAGEGVRFWRKREIDFGMLASMSIGATALLITFPPMLHGLAGLLQAVKNSRNFWARPHLNELFFYLKMFPSLNPPLIVGAGAVGALLRYGIFPKNRAGGENARPLPQVRAEDLAIGLMLALILPVMLLVSQFEAGYFMPRYAIGSDIGIAILLGLLPSPLSRRLPGVSAFAPAAVLYCSILALLTLWVEGPVPESPGLQSTPLFHSAPEGEPIVIAGAVPFLPTWYYSDPRTRARLHYLSDLSYAVKQPDFIPEYTLTLEQPYGAPKIDPYKIFLASHREFLLYCVGFPRFEWVKDRLIHEGWTLNSIASEGTETLYRVVAPSPVSK